MALLPSRYRAMVPAPWGEAIDVPEIVSESVSLPFQAEVIPSPGANRSTTEPKFENQAIESLISEAPTVKAAATCAGEKLPASLLLFPAATATLTPVLIVPSKALSIEKLTGPPMLMFATAGVDGFALCALATKFNPPTIASVGQLPPLLQTFTERMVTFFATP